VQNSPARVAFRWDTGKANLGGDRAEASAATPEKAGADGQKVLGDGFAPPPRERANYMLDVLFRAPARLLSASSSVLRDVPTFRRMWWSLPLP
jgi:hypothetical protein